MFDKKEKILYVYSNLGGRVGRYFLHWTPPTGYTVLDRLILDNVLPGMLDRCTDLQDKEDIVESQLQNIQNYIQVAEEREIERERERDQNMVLNLLRYHHRDK